MTKKPSRPAAREDRRGDRARTRNDQPLINFAKEDEYRREPRRAARANAVALTDAQRAYDAMFKSKDIIFGIGPAGTGKTWFAIQRAAEALKNKEIEKIYLTRPNVEVERGFGFLPGSLEEKFDPYILPVREALEEAFGASHLDYLLKAKVIDPRPLAFMRGSTIKNGWLIADEMQNASPGEFKMLLTRFGENSKYIVNGDPTQCDLTGYGGSGLEDAVKRTKWLDEVGIVRFTRDDIVRHDLCQKIVDSYTDN